VLLDTLQRQPERYLDELCDDLRERTAVSVAPSTVCRWLRALSLRRKRVTAVAPQRNSERVRALRSRFITVTQPSFPPVLGHLLTLDETHVDERSSHRQYGRALGADKCVVSRAYNGGTARRQRVTVVRAIGVQRSAHSGKLELCTAERVILGSSNAATMQRFVAEELRPLADRMYANNVALAAAAAAVDDDDSTSSSDSSASSALSHHPQMTLRERRPCARNDDFVYDDDDDAASSTSNDSSNTVSSYDSDDGEYCCDDDNEQESSQSRDSISDGDDSSSTSDNDSAAGNSAFARRSPHSVIVLQDNWSGHRSECVRREYSRSAGIMWQRFVPPYSPDLNWPVECSFHDLKQWLRRHAYWSSASSLQVSTIERALTEYRSSPQAIHAFLARARHAGYNVSDELLAEAKAMMQ
jgi:transposase